MIISCSRLHKKNKQTNKQQKRQNKTQLPAVNTRAVLEHEHQFLSKLFSLLSLMVFSTVLNQSLSLYIFFLFLQRGAGGTYENKKANQSLNLFQIKTGLKPFSLTGVVGTPDTKKGGENAGRFCIGFVFPERFREHTFLFILLRIIRIIHIPS